ncbi:MAG: YHYH protein [Sphingobacteriia bacterium]|nr:YHYH protein [Sphingobacteriia bacterium]
MKNIFIYLALILSCSNVFSQGPNITSWIQNLTGTTGRHYVSGNPTPINDSDSVNVQGVLYSTTSVYVRTKGVPAYITGPFLDGNPSFTTSQNATFKFPLTPTPNTGNPTPTTGGNIGLFINGVALFDYRDGISWKSSTSSLAGGPLGGMGDGVWNRDAVVAEKAGFDCSKGHPAMGNYHHHQNPSAFKLDLTVISTICNLYDADGLYTPDSAQHSPLIGFAYDGYPIYGAYAYKNVDGTGGITRMKSGFTLRNISTRTTLYTGATVTAGPPVSTTYPLGYFKEDYQYNSPTTSDSLDIHNGRFCVTPEYPSGTYAYFCTVDENWNSTYPYVVGPTFYGVKSATKLTGAITESVTPYIPTTQVNKFINNPLEVSVYPNPTAEWVAVQLGGINTSDVKISLWDNTGKLIQDNTIFSGSTIGYFDIRLLYSGEYWVIIENSTGKVSKLISVVK